MLASLPTSAHDRFYEKQQLSGGIAVALGKLRRRQSTAVDNARRR